MKRNKSTAIILAATMIISNTQMVVSYADMEENVKRSGSNKNTSQINLIGTDINGGIIRNSITWTKEGSPYRINGEVQLAYGATLTIEPGVEIEGNYNDFKIYGSLVAKGNTDDKIKFNNVNILGWATHYNDYFNLDLDNIVMNGGELLPPGGNTGHGEINIKNSIFKNLTNYTYIWYPKSEIYITGNIFSNCMEISIGSDFNSYIQNNVFYNIKSKYSNSVIKAWANYKKSKTYVEKNTFFNEDVVLKNEYKTGNIVGTNNYWNTTDIEDIKKRLHDNNVDLSTPNIIEFEPILTAPHEDTPSFSIPMIEANDVSIKIGDEFNPNNGVSAKDKEDGNITGKIEVIKNTVDTTKVGKYEVVYKVTDSHGASTTKMINITVNPRPSMINSAPIINVEDTTIKVGDEFNPRSGVSANDKEDGNITEKIEVIKNTVDTSNVGEYEVVYKVTDSQGASKTKTIKVTVRSNEKPIINAEDITIKVGDEFNPRSGITAKDKEDGDITENIKIVENTVSTETYGEYKVVYEVKDSDENITRKEIKVKVNPRPSIINSAPTINGEDIAIKVGDEFNPRSGVTAKDKEDGNITEKIEVIKNTVDTSNVGEYEVVYKVTDSQGASKTKTIKVTVRSNEKPIINAEDITIKVGDEFNPRSGVTAKDKEDGDITENIKIVENTVSTETYGEYKVVYEVKDSDENITRKEIKVKVNPRPSIINSAPTINGEDIAIKVGDEFNPRSGVTANDKEDGDITEKIEVIKNTVDTSQAGEYEVIYKVTDSQGASKTKAIKVKVKPRPSIINSAPTINAKDIRIKVGDEFNPRSGVSANDKEDGDITEKIEVIKNTVDTSNVGEYEVVYKVTDSQGASKTKTIKVTVRSNEKPIINAEDITIKVGDEFNPRSGVTAKDKEDGDITENIKIVENTVSTETYGEYKVVYEVKDSDENITRKEIKVKVNPRLSIINSAPTINAEDIAIKVGDEFNPNNGVSANDKEDGDITEKIEVIKNTVDTSQAGEYEVIYKVTDSQGASKTKAIKVKVNPRLSIINNIPIINAEDITIKVGDEFNPNNGVSANDKEDGDITEKIEVIKNTVDTSQVGEYEVVYKVTDSQRAVAEKSIIVTVIKNEEEMKPVVENELVGESRYSTAIKVSNRGWSNAENIVLVNSGAIVDALSATPFAKAKNAPILLTESNKLNNETKNEILRLGAKNVYIVGGEGVISNLVVSQLNEMGLEVDRISGDTRYETSLEIAKRLENVSEIAVVNGVTGLPDAVSIAPVAASKNMPIVLASPTDGTKEFDEFIKNNGIERSYVIGGENAISDSVVNKLPNPKRLGGISRNETNAIIIEEFYTDKILNNIFVSKDGGKKVDDLIDALAVGVLASKEESPVVIVSNTLDNKQKSVLSSKLTKEVTKVGGNGNENAFEELINIFKTEEQK